MNFFQFCSDFVAWLVENEVQLLAAKLKRQGKPPCVQPLGFSHPDENGTTKTISARDKKWLTYKTITMLYDNVSNALDWKREDCGQSGQEKCRVAWPNAVYYTGMMMRKMQMSRKSETQQDIDEKNKCRPRDTENEYSNDGHHQPRVSHKENRESIARVETESSAITGFASHAREACMKI